MLDCGLLRAAVSLRRHGQSLGSKVLFVIAMASSSRSIAWADGCCAEIAVLLSIKSGLEMLRRHGDLIASKS